MPKASTNRGDKPRHNPLADDLVAPGHLRTKSGKRKSRHAEEKEEENYVDSKASKRILKMARALEEENGVKPPTEELTEAQRTAFELDPRFLEDDEDEGEGVYDDEGFEDEEDVEHVELTPDQLHAYHQFNGRTEDPLLRNGWDGAGEDTDQDQRPDTYLADLMLRAIAEKEARDARADGNNDRMSEAAEDEFELHPKVVEVYSKIGLILSRYKSGKLPKPFKILPNTPHWEEIIELTRPDKWTANACYEATRLFVSSTPATVQKFLNMILLPRVTSDIYETKKLSPHLFDAMKRALYKPASFFKGFLFPLVEGGECTLREADIISGVLVRVSIPILHSAAAIKGLCDIAAVQATVGNEAGGATNIFIKALLDKKYALPHQAIDALVFHFLRFRSVDSSKADAMQGVTGLTQKQAKEIQLPVRWHQCLLTFAQHYRDAITEDQREALLDLLLTKGHAKIGPEVRRELLQGRGRGVLLEQVQIVDGDDTMMMD